MAASACSLAFVGENLQLILKKSSLKMTEKKLADFRYSVVIADVSDIGQGRQIWEGEAQLLLWAGSLAILVKITSSGIPDLLNDCAIFL
jgi:hypothetical protein